MAFQNTSDALEWCMEAQQELVKLAWPEALLDHPGAAEEWGEADNRVIFKGLRVRMGVHVGQPRMVRDPMTRRVEYIGPVINAAARITAMTHGGQILLSGATFDKVRESDLASKEAKRMVCLGKFEMPDSPKGTHPRSSSLSIHPHPTHRTAAAFPVDSNLIARACAVCAVWVTNL